MYYAAILGSGQVCTMQQFRLWASMHIAQCCNSLSAKLCAVLQFSLWTSIHSIAIYALDSGQVCTMQQFILWKIVHYAAINALDNYALCSNSFLLFSHSRVTNTLYGSYSSRKNKLRWLAHRWGRIRWWGYTTAGLRNCFHTLCVGCVVLYPV